MEYRTVNQSRKKSALTGPASSEYIEFGELQKSVCRLSAHNRKKYEEILDSKSNFSYQLYKINENKAISVSFGRQLLMKQMDRLMEEEHFLNREISHIAIEKEEHFEAKETMVENEINAFQVLKSIWSRQNKHYENSIDHADSLNHTLGHIRLSIKKIADMERENQPETHPQYLKTVAKLRQPSDSCLKCQSHEQQKKQLRVKIQSLQHQLTSLSDSTKHLQTEIASKNESLRRLNKKMIQLQTESHSKVMYLEQKLLMEDHQIKLLKKFKAQLEKNVFIGPNYQLFLKTQEDLSQFDRTFSVDLEELLSYCIRPVENSVSFVNQPEEKSKEQIGMSQDLLLELNLPLNCSQNYKKAHTERPKTDRRRNMAQNAIPVQQLECMGKKYLRTNQLTSKRSRQVPVTPIQNKHTISTLQLSDSPKSIEQRYEQ